jgi:hypothetical protein
LNRKITALIATLILIAAAALPALATTVVDELAAYWEKADPIYAQIQGLGARQEEIYQEFGL